MEGTPRHQASREVGTYRPARSERRGFQYGDERASQKGVMRATWNDAVLVDSNDTVVVEGKHYFPEDQIDKQYFQPSDTHTTCPWKGEASYFNIVVNGQINKDAAWFYPDPKPAAAEIKDRVAFWRGVKVESN